jgi:2-oxoisovalerate dehydrogenase E1 component alpha subunit
MPSHFSSPQLGMLSSSSPVATQVPQAAGAALACKLRGEDRVVVVTLGEGSTSEGDWYEGLNWAGVHHLPLICLVENNIYAISVPIQLQMAVPNVATARRCSGSPDDCGWERCPRYRTTKEAAECANGAARPGLAKPPLGAICPTTTTAPIARARGRRVKQRIRFAFSDYLRDKGLLMTAD